MKSFQISKLVNQILNEKGKNPKANTSKLEAEIDRLVYDLYDLTDEEIEIFKGSEGFSDLFNPIILILGMNIQLLLSYLLFLHWSTNI